MGYSRWDASDWSSYSTAAATKSTAQIFSSSSLNKDLDPRFITVRESRDSVQNPMSTPIIIASDVTGSMGMISDHLIRSGLGTLVGEIINRQPVQDPQICCMAIGDILCDRAPLQVTQFEPDVGITSQIEKTWLEKGGGGNLSESYQLPWYFATFHTATDAYDLRGEKGYLITIGDEEVPPTLTKEQLARIGLTAQKDYTSEELYELVSEKYHTFHIIVEQGHHMSRRAPQVRQGWKELMGDHAILLSDYTKLSEVVVSVIQINEGVDRFSVIDSWDKETSAVVAHAVGGIQFEETV